MLNTIAADQASARSIRAKLVKRAALVLLSFLWMSALSGCASLNTVVSDVSSYGQWPTQRKPNTYRFERLPSQQAHAEQQAQLERLAKPSIEAVGFQPSPDGAQADVNIQVAMRTSRIDLSPREDPFWWRGSFYNVRPGRYFYHPHSYYGYGYGYGTRAYYTEYLRFTREVVVLIRDAGSNQMLYETHAMNEGNTPGHPDVLGAMFRASLLDFPHTGPNPRQVNVPLQAH
jgi:hypothetical protein